MKESIGGYIVKRFCHRFGQYLADKRESLKIVKFKAQEILKPEFAIVNENFSHERSE